MRAVYRDNLELSGITDDVYRRWYAEDHNKIGSLWTPHHGGAFFRPSFQKGEGWAMIHREDDHVVLQNPDGRARLDKQHRICFAAAFEGNMLLAHDLRPKLAYRYDHDKNCFVPDEERGTIFIRGMFPDFRVVNDNVPVHMGADFNFYFDEQPDIMHAAKVGRMGTIFDTVAKAERVRAVLRFCLTCDKVISPAAPKTQMYCSVACGHQLAPDAALAGRRFECLTCGASFHRKGSGNYHYCSATCHANAKNLKRPAKKLYTCQYCGNKFHQAGSGNHQFCHSKCREAKRSIDMMQSKKPPKIRTSTCDHCGYVFDYHARGPARRYCSNFCKTMG